MKNRIQCFPQECPHCHEKSITYFLKLRMIDDFRHNNPPKSRSCPCCKKPLKRKSTTWSAVLKHIFNTLTIGLIVFFNFIKIPGTIEYIIILTVLLVGLFFKGFVDIPSSEMYVDE